MELALQGLAGVIIIPLLAWAISENRNYLGVGRTLLVVLGTILVQVLFALAILNLQVARTFFDLLGQGVVALQAATDKGAQLLFGYLAGGEAPFDSKKPSLAVLLAFKIFPIILVLSAIVRLLYHWGVLQRIVAGFAFLLKGFVGTGGPLATASAASIFLGLVEAPLMIRPYLREMHRGALFAMMVVLMSTVAGTVMALYASILAPIVKGSAGHLLAGSIMNVPGALMLARLAVPEGFDTGPKSAEIHLEDPPTGSMDAIVQGAFEGIKLVVTVAALLIVIVSLVALVNGMLTGVGGHLGTENLTLQKILGFIMAPVAFLIGIPWSEAMLAGGLLGQKLVLNEFLAYLDMTQMPLTGDGSLSERSRLILTYALCGFANLGSLGILIGALSTMVPERRAEITTLAPKSVLIGFMATLLSAAIISCIA